MRTIRGVEPIHGLFFVLTIGLYLPGLFWGLPHATGPESMLPWGHDSLLPMSPLGEMHDTFIAPAEHPLLTYPLMHHFVLAAFDAPYLGALFLTGGMGRPTAGYPFGFSDPATALLGLILIGRAVSLMMGGVLVAASFEVGRRLWGRTAGLVTASFSLLLYPMFYYTQTGNLEVPSLCWIALALVVYAGILRSGFTVRRAAWLGVFAAFATATKDSSAALFFVMPLALVPLHAGASGGSRTWAFWKPVAALLGAGGAAYALTSGLLLGPSRYFAHVAHITGFGAEAAGIEPITLPSSYPATLAGFVALGAETWGWLVAIMGLPMLLLALFGMALCLRRDPRALAFSLPAWGLLLGFIAPIRYAELRYVWPVALVSCAFAAYPVARALQAERAAWRAVGWTALAFAFAIPALNGAAMTDAKLRDSRLAAAAWIGEHTAPGDAIGFFGPSQKLPRIASDRVYARVVPFTGTRAVSYAPSDIDAMAERIRAAAPKLILLIEDHSLQPGMRFGNTAPDALVDRLRDGAHGYRLAARIETPPLWPWLERPPLTSYRVVSPPVEILERVDRAAARRIGRDSGPRRLPRRG